MGMPLLITELVELRRSEGERRSDTGMTKEEKRVKRGGLIRYVSSDRSFLIITLLYKPK